MSYPGIPGHTNQLLRDTALAASRQSAKALETRAAAPSPQSPLRRAGEAMRALPASLFNMLQLLSFALIRRKQPVRRGNSHLAGGLLPPLPPCLPHSCSRPPKLCSRQQLIIGRPPTASILEIYSCSLFSPRLSGYKHESSLILRKEEHHAKGESTCWHNLWLPGSVE